MQHSLSIFVVYIATDIDLSALPLSHESFCYRDFDHERNFDRTRYGEIAWLSITAPTLVEPDLAPPDRHLLLLTTLLPYQAEPSWRQAKPDYMDAMLKLAAQYIPGLENHILHVEGGSPATMRRYTANPRRRGLWLERVHVPGGARADSESIPIKGLYFSDP